MPGSLPPGYDAVIKKNNAIRAAKGQKFGNGGGAFSSKPSPSRGGNAARVAKAAAKKKTIPKPSGGAGGGVTSAVNNYGITSGSTQIPDTSFDPNQTVEDQALTGNYNTNVPQTDSTKIAGLAGNVQLPNALNYANNMANLQYGNKIQQIAGRIKGLTSALPGALQALDKAFGNLDQQRAAIAPNITSGAGVANLFGGNTGAAAVAANQAQQAQATADNQTGIASDHTQANATRQADWATRIQLLNNMAVNQGRSELTGAIGERDAAKKGYFDQGLKMRGDMVSQAIGNQGALNNQRIASALASGQIESLKLGNIGKGLQNTITGINADALPDQLAISIAAGKQGIINSVTQNSISAATAKAQLKQLAAQSTSGGGVDNLAKARAAGGDGALYSMILPGGAVVQNAETGGYKLNGDPNKYFKLGVSNIMSALPKSDRKRVEQFVSNKIQQALQTTGGWSYKNGKYVKTAKK